MLAIGIVTILFSVGLRGEKDAGRERSMAKSAAFLIFEQLILMMEKLDLVLHSFKMNALTISIVFRIAFVALALMTLVFGAK